MFLFWFVRQFRFQGEPRDLIRLDSSSSIGDFDPLTNGEHLQTSSTDSSGMSSVVGVSNPLYSFYYINNNKKPGQKDSDLLNEYGINFTNLRLPNETEGATSATETTVAKSKSEWTKFEWSVHLSAVKGKIFLGRRVRKGGCRRIILSAIFKNYIETIRKS